MAKQTSFANTIEGAAGFDELKARLVKIFHDLESIFDSKTNIFFVDAQTNTDPNQYNAGDIIVDSTIIPGSITIYAYDAKKNKIAQSLRSFTGSLPISNNENFAGDGVNKNFATQFQFDKNSTQVYVAGLRKKLGTDYTENAATLKQIIFTAAPANAAVIIVDYVMATVL